MSNRRNSKIRALTGLMNAQARHVNARARQSEASADNARLELDGQRFNDAVAQRERFVDVVEQGRIDYEVKVFEYERVLHADKPSTRSTFTKGTQA